MRVQKKILRTAMVVLLSINFMMQPISAANYATAYVAEPRFNNISAATLGLGFDENYVAHCEIVMTSIPGVTTGFEGQLRLTDSSGTLVKSWAISDYEAPFAVEKTWQCEYGETYTLLFQGYAYGTNMFDDFTTSISAKCE